MLNFLKKIKNKVVSMIATIIHSLVYVRNQLQKQGSTLYHFQWQHWVTQKIREREYRVEAWRSTTLKLVFLYMATIVLIFGIGAITSHYTIAFQPFSVSSREVLWALLIVLLTFLVLFVVWVIYMALTDDFLDSPEVRVTRTLTRCCVWAALGLGLVSVVLFLDHSVLGKDPVVFSFYNLYIIKIYWSNDQLFELGRQYVAEQLSTIYRLRGTFSTSDLFYLATQADVVMESVVEKSQHTLHMLQSNLDEVLRKGAEELQDRQRAVVQNQNISQSEVEDSAKYQTLARFLWVVCLTYFLGAYIPESVKSFLRNFQ